MHSPIPMLLAVCLPLTWSPAAAQTDAESPPAAQTEPQFRFGVQVGLNSSTFGGDDSDGLDHRTSYRFGGFVDVRLSSWFSLQPEVAYSRQGADASAAGIDLAINTDYLQVPVLLKAGAALAATSSIRPILYAGPYIGFKLQCKIKVSGAGIPTQEEDCGDVGGLADKSTDFGAIVGGGLEFDRFSASARYAFGLTSVDDSNADLDIKSRVLTVLVGVRF